MLTNLRRFHVTRKRPQVVKYCISIRLILFCMFLLTYKIFIRKSTKSGTFPYELEESEKGAKSVRGCFDRVFSYILRPIITGPIIFRILIHKMEITSVSFIIRK